MSEQTLEERYEQARLDEEVARAEWKVSFQETNRLSAIRNEAQARYSKLGAEIADRRNDEEYKKLGVNLEALRQAGISIQCDDSTDLLYIEIDRLRNFKFEKDAWVEAQRLVNEGLLEVLNGK